VYNIIENDRFSTGKNAAVIRVIDPCGLVVNKWAEAPQNSKPPPAVQSGSVPP